MVERLKSDEPKHREVASTRFYVASSIADSVGSRTEIVEEIISEHEGWHQSLSRFDRFDYSYKHHIIHPIVRVIGPELFVSNPHAIVFLPPVRHFPQDDPPENKGRVVSIQDPTGTCDVELPLGFNRANVIRNESLRRDPKLYAENAWSGIVALLNVYNLPKGDRSILVYVDRIIDMEKEKAKAFSKMLKAFGQSGI